MAVWQYQLNIIPKKAILEKYNKIPKSLFIDYDAWEKYWDNVKINSNNEFPKPNFEDAKTIKWWKNTKIDIKKITEHIDKYVNRGDWNDDEKSGFIGWKGDVLKNEDNDALIAFDVESKIISEFQFRTDLRNKENAMKFMNGMLDICKQYNLMVMNTKGLLFEPEPKLIYEDLKKSNAVDFLTDPIKFLDKIVENEKKSEKRNIWAKIKAFWN